MRFSLHSNFTSTTHLNMLYVQIKKTKEKSENGTTTAIKSFMDIPPVDAACQLTLYESTIFRRVSPFEFMHQVTISLSGLSVS